jgi:hypothetical protein
MACDVFVEAKNVLHLQRNYHNTRVVNSLFKSLYSLFLLSWILIESHKEYEWKIFSIVHTAKVRTRLMAKDFVSVDYCEYILLSDLCPFLLQLHLVHWNSNKYANCGEAAGYPDGLAVLGVLLKVSNVIVSI